MLQRPELPPPDSRLLLEFLTEHHDVFSLEDGERKDTELVCIEINIGDASPRKQPPSCMPFIVRQEVEKQLRSMQQNGVIRPSFSSWSSPVIMVRKVRSHRFCVGYRGLNVVTKHFDCRPRVWILMEPLSQEKTAL